ncbi:MAG: hypothetical protein WCA20_12535 [Candidatus Sulfotelmatobacter sp.]
MQQLVKKSVLKLLVPMQSLGHQCLEFWCGGARKNDHEDRRMEDKVGV